MEGFDPNAELQRLGFSRESYKQYLLANIPDKPLPDLSEAVALYDLYKELKTSRKHSPALDILLQNMYVDPVKYQMFKRAEWNDNILNAYSDRLTPAQINRLKRASSGDIFNVILD